jgi:hypothetical protein
MIERKYIGQRRMWPAGMSRTEPVEVTCTHVHANYIISADEVKESTTIHCEFKAPYTGTGKAWFTVAQFEALRRA